MSHNKPSGQTAATSQVHQTTRLNQSEQVGWGMRSPRLSGHAWIERSSTELYPGAILRERNGMTATRGGAPPVSVFAARQECETGLAAKRAHGERSAGSNGLAQGIHFRGKTQSDGEPNRAEAYLARRHGAGRYRSGRGAVSLCPSPSPARCLLRSPAWRGGRDGTGSMVVYKRLYV